MPVLEIQALPQKGSVELQWVCTKLAEAVGEIVGVPPENVRVLWKTLHPGHYMAGAEDAQEQPAGTRPPVVRVNIFEGQKFENVEKLLVRIADTLCQEIHIDQGNVVIEYNQIRSGNFYSRGGIRT